MPELPEVEVVRCGLAAHLRGRCLTGVEVLHPRAVRRHSAGIDDFQVTLEGRTFAEPRRRGKYLWLPFTDGDALVVHLGMSGQFRVDDEPADDRHTRVRFHLDDGRQVRFVDQRTFGGVHLSVEGAELPTEIAHIGRDPFDPEFDVEDAISRFRRRRSGVKRALLDQAIVSGIGNIYADETLWRCRIHPERACERLSRHAWREIIDAATAVMEEALAQGGTSFDALYVNVNGESGYFERGLAAYGREGSPCQRCGALIVREAFMNRSSFRCPRCQRTPPGTGALIRRPHRTGPRVVKS